MFRAKGSKSFGPVTIEQTGGLWQQCTSGAGPLDGCVSIGSTRSSLTVDGKLNGARAFMILAILASAPITILIFLSSFIESSNPAIAQVTRFGALIVLPIGIIGVALGISFYSGGDGTLGAAGYLAIVSLVLNLIAGGIAVMIR